MAVIPLFSMKMVVFYRYPGAEWQAAEIDGMEFMPWL